MPRLRPTLSVLVLLPAFLSIQAQTVETRPATATVSGRVLLKGEPTQGVSVALQSHTADARNQDSVLRSRTDGAGRFRITGVAAGQYSIIAFAPGAISPSDLDFLGKTQPGRTIDVREGENVESMDLALSPGGVITGRVTDPGGRPFVDEPVTLFRLDPQAEWQQFSGPPNGAEMFYTDDRGVYRIFGLPAGRYIISAGFEELSGWNTTIPNRVYHPRAFHLNAPDESQAKVIDVAEGFEATNIDIMVGASKRTYDLYGRVLNADTGQPAPGFYISHGAVRDGRIPYTRSNSERSGANGEFRVIGLIPGKYGINARSQMPLATPMPARSQDDDNLICDETRVEITDSDLRGVEIKCRPGGSVSGVVAIEGTNDPKILSRLSQINLIISTSGGLPLGPPISVGANGSFQVRGLARGRLVIGLISREDLNLRLSRIELNGAPRESIEINPGEHITGLRVVFTPEGNQ